MWVGPVAQISIVTKLHHYVSMIVFTLGFVVGIQVPNFVDQYTKRVDAHFQEASSHLQGYQKIADLNHGGSLDRLIQKHANSNDPTFREETAVIQNLLGKQRHYQQEQRALSQGWPKRIQHMILSGDREILRQTYRQYAPGVPLAMEAVVAGFAVALLFSLCLELFAGLLLMLFGSRRRRQPMDVRPH